MKIHHLTHGSYGSLSTIGYYTTEAGARAAIADHVLGGGTLMDPVGIEEIEVEGELPSAGPSLEEMRSQLTERPGVTIARQLRSLRERLAEALGHDVVPDDDGLVVDVAEYVRRFRAHVATEGAAVDPVLDTEARA